MKHFNRPLVHCLTALMLVCLAGLTACQKATPESLLEEAGLMIQSRDIYAAELKFQKLIEKFPDSPEALQARMGLAYCYQLNKDYDAAREQLDQVIAQLGGPATEEGFGIFTEKLKTYVEQQKFQPAIDLMVETSPTLKTLSLERRTYFQLNLAGLYFRNNQEEQGLATARAAFEAVVPEPNLHLVPLQLMQQYYDEKRDHESIRKLYDEYLQRFPTSPHRSFALFNLAMSEQSLGQREVATAHFAESEQLLRKEIDATLGADQKVQMLIKLVGMYQMRDMMSEARQTLESIMKDYPTSAEAPSALLFLAQMDMQAGDKTAAEANLKRMLSEYPNSQRTQQAIAMLQQLQSADIPGMTTQTQALVTTATMATTVTTPAEAAPSTDTQAVAQ